MRTIKTYFKGAPFYNAFHRIWEFLACKFFESSAREAYDALFRGVSWKFKFVKAR